MIKDNLRKQNKGWDWKVTAKSADRTLEVKDKIDKFEEELFSLLKKQGIIANTHVKKKKKERTSFVAQEYLWHNNYKLHQDYEQVQS